jgi:hypothetical protein
VPESAFDLANDPLSKALVTLTGCELIATVALMYYHSRRAGVGSHCLDDSDYEEEESPAERRATVGPNIHLVPTDFDDNVDDNNNNRDDDDNDNNACESDDRVDKRARKLPADLEATRSDDRVDKRTRKKRAD